MNIQTLENIYAQEGGRPLNILVNDVKLQISDNALMALGKFGNIVIAVGDHYEESALSRYFGIKNYKISNINQIIINNYDIILSINNTPLTTNFINYFKPKYVLFFNDNEILSDNNYFKSSSEYFRRVDKSIYENTISVSKNERYDSEKRAYFDTINPVEIKYNKYTINYIHPQIDGKISIIMIVSEPNNKFPETIKNIKAQNLADVEFIIIDNSGGFRNNVKPDIRYKDKMPFDFCVYHAKELCTGEYMIILNEGSDAPDVLGEIVKGKYEVR